MKVLEQVGHAFLRNDPLTRHYYDIIMCSKLLVWRGAAAAAAADDIVAAISAICSLQQMEQWNSGTLEQQHFIFRTARLPGFYIVFQKNNADLCTVLLQGDIELVTQFSLLNNLSIILVLKDSSAGGSNFTLQTLNFFAQSSKEKIMLQNNPVQVFRIKLSRYLVKALLLLDTPKLICGKLLCEVAK